MPPKRSKGVTFKLVQQSYEDANADEPGRSAAVMVDERELRSHLPAGSAAATRRRRERTETTADINAWASEWNTAAVARLPEEEAYMNRRNMLRAQDDDDDDDDVNVKKGAVSASKRNHEETEDVAASETESDDKLFDDQEEVEFTDDFLRELVLGGGDNDDDDANNNNNNYNYNNYDDNSDADDGDGAAGDAGGVSYPQHDVSARGAERQFTRMMREFDADARLNDAYTDDPRTYGGAGVSQYLRALEEFVVDRAGLDCDTAAPRRNRGLLQQLRTLAQHAGTDMSPSGEVHTTTVMPDRHARFVEEFRNETLEIRRAARERVLSYQKEQQQQGGGEGEGVMDGEGEEKKKSTSEGTAPARNAVIVAVGEREEEEEEEEEEAYIVRELKDKANRMDCETVVSTYSTYFNQPNVIRAAPTGKRRKGRGDAESTLLSSTQEEEEEEDDEEEVPDLYAQMLMLTRDKEETKEEKKLRKQLAKQAQRERRSKKKELRHAYKVLEVDEAKRSKESQTAKKTVHFF
ncbi:uncharacterized protein TM35_000092510 [Trypanosoma theileri]|uniref:Protein LTV1 n=1 Tax=Trypanosoma theileri TaxID=67003 RepID=A0A1X0P023_9TRYP|nr:uncharacterized protein TM35_000092510 [Trypanosoma theileri]ORC90201.1 hypothetical protein TM35_000092510 [Trypanosoma theileri]